MVKFSNYLRKEKCCLIQGSDVFPSALEKKYGCESGMYFDGRGPAVLMRPAEAGMSQVDALFSIKAGKLAIFFIHEGWAWHCEQ